MEEGGLGGLELGLGHGGAGWRVVWKVLVLVEEWVVVDVHLLLWSGSVAIREQSLAVQVMCI